MMHEKELDRKAAGKFAWFAAKDARQRSLTNSSLYSNEQKVAAERMKLGLEFCYSAKEIHIEFRKKFISVKVDGPTVKDRKILALLESDYAKVGHEKCKTSQGVTYRIFRIEKV